MPYLELLIRNGLAVRVDGTVTKYKTTPKGMEALRHFRKLDMLIPERRDLPVVEERRISRKVLRTIKTKSHLVVSWA